MSIVKVTEKGQLTLPIELPRKLRINKDDYLSVEAEGEVLTLRKVRERKLLGSNDPIWDFRPGLSVGEIYFTGNGSSGAGEKAQALGSRTGIKTMLWRAFDEMRDRLDKTISLLQPKLGVPLGLAIGAVYPPEKSLDLRREEFVPKTYFNLRKMFLFMGAGLLLLAVLHTVNVYQKAYYQERQYNRLQAQVRQVFTEAFPDATQKIVRGQEVAQLEQKIQRK